MCIEAKIVNVFTKGGAVHRASVVSHFMEELSNDLVEDDSEEDNDNDKEYDENVKLIDIDFNYSTLILQTQL